MLKRILVLLVLLIIGIIVYSLIINLKIPTNLGVVEGRFQNLKSTPNGVSTQALDLEKKVKTISYEDLSIVKPNMIKAIKDLGGKIIKDKDNYLYAVFTSKGFKFKDDVQVYFDETNKKIEFKSESRLGKSDLGINRKRYEKLMKKL